MAPRQPVFDPARVEALMNSGDFASALPMLAAGAKASPNDPQILHFLGVCQLRTGRVRDAVVSLRKSTEKRSTADAVVQLALAYRLAGRSEEAAETLKAGMSKHAGEPAIVRATIEHSIDGREYESAVEQIKAMPGLDRKSPDIQLLEAKALSSLDRKAEALGIIRAITSAQGVSPLRLLAAHYREGDILDSMGEYADAFDAYRRANELNQASFDAERFRFSVDRLLEAWTPEALESNRARSDKSSLAVFILGMPRSGTTLVEQIIDRHSRVHGAGELTTLNNAVCELQQRAYEQADVLVSLEKLGARSIERAGRTYIRELRTHAKDADRITDKLPSNFRHVGFIAASLPDASIVHTIRNPLDTALSCYFQNFGATNGWSISPESIGVYYNGYARLMAHWRSLGIEMLDVEYESLVADQEAQSRRLIDGIGLEWEDRCLSFHESERVAMTASSEQVRRPMYSSSVARHEKYRAHLGPFIEAMGL